MAAPTFAQEQYADALVKELRENNWFDTERYARAVLRCTDRQEMSALINEMKKILEAPDSMSDRL